MSDGVAREWYRAVGYLDELAESLSVAVGLGRFIETIKILNKIKSNGWTSEDCSYVMTWSRIQAEASPVEAVCGLGAISLRFNAEQRTQILQKMVEVGFDPFWQEPKTEGGRFMRSRDEHHLVRFRDTSPLRTLAENYGTQDGFEPLEIILEALAQRDGFQAVQEKWDAHRIVVPAVYGNFQLQFQFNPVLLIPAPHQHAFRSFWGGLTESGSAASLTPAIGLAP